jgi:hypothetical protein
MKIRWSLIFFWVFCASLPNQVKHTCLKFQLQICKYEWARIIFDDGGLDSKLQHYGPCKNSWKKIKNFTFRLYWSHCRWRHAEPWAKKKVKRSEKPRFYGQNKLFFENPALQPLGSFSHMAACRSSLKNTWKMSLILVFNKKLPQAHTESELGVLGVHGKLVKYVVHSSKRKNWRKIIFLHTGCPNSNRPILGLKKF